MQTQIRLLLEEVWSGSTLVCHSVCIVWTHYSMVEPLSSNFRVFTTNFLVVRIFRKFTVNLNNHYELCFVHNTVSFTVTFKLKSCIISVFKLNLQHLQPKNWVWGLSVEVKVVTFGLKWLQTDLELQKVMSKWHKKWSYLKRSVRSECTPFAILVCIFWIHLW